MASQRYHPSITDNCETTCCKPVKDYFMGKKQVYQIRKQRFNCLIGRQRLIREASHRERCRSAVRVYPLGMSLLTILAVFLGFSVKLQDDCVNMTWLTITRLSTQFYTVLHFYSTPIVYVRYLKFKTNVYRCEQYIICLCVCSKLQCSGGEYGTFVASTGQAQMDCFFYCQGAWW